MDTFVLDSLDLMFAGKIHTLIYFASLFSPYDFLKNDSIILKYLKIEWK